MITHPVCLSSNVQSWGGGCGLHLLTSQHYSQCYKTTFTESDENFWLKWGTCTSVTHKCYMNLGEKQTNLKINKTAGLKSADD